MTNRTVVLMLAAALAACQTPQSRIKKNQNAFNAYPPEIQRAIREGRVEVGFTAEQAMIALGKPDRVYTTKTATSNQEFWEYGIGRSNVGFGFGISSMGGGSGYGTGVGVNTSDVGDPRARMRIAFENGKVVSVERREL